MDNIESIVDPEVLPALGLLPEELVTAIGDEPPTARAIFNGMLEAMLAQAPPHNLTVEERMIPGPDGDVKVVIYQPPGDDAPRGGLLWIHGGGYIIGTGNDDLNCPMIGQGVGCTIVSVDYRVAPEHPFPAGAEDCYAALDWMFANAAELGVDPKRIAIGGGSAGGGLAAGLAQMNRDRAGHPIKLQWLLYPMIDDTHNTPSGDRIRDERTWHRELSDKAWKMYLGDSYGGDVSPYAAASRATDLSGLPPAFISVGDADLFCDENIAYAEKLKAAGVPVELQVYPGMFHGGELFAPTAAVSGKMIGDYLGALAKALA